MERFAERGVEFEGGVEEPFEAVILATGFRPGLERLLGEVAGVLDRDGRPVASGAELAHGNFLCGFLVSPTGMLREVGLEARRIARSSRVMWSGPPRWRPWNRCSDADHRLPPSPTVSSARVYSGALGLCYCAPMSRGVIDRRRFARSRVPILVRPAGFLARIAPRLVDDISIGGLRTHTDEALRLGTRLELELFFPDGGSATCLAEVVWAEPLPEGGAARFEVGLRFVQADPADLERIAALLRS